LEFETWNSARGLLAVEAEEFGRDDDSDDDRGDHDREFSGSAFEVFHVLIFNCAATLRRLEGAGNMTTRGNTRRLATTWGKC
jgi:hypothetical protein